MAFKQLNRYAEMVIVCHGDRRYGAETSFEENVLVSVLAGELKVVQADRTFYCAAGDTLLLPRKQPATLIKYPKDGAAYHDSMRNEKVYLNWKTLKECEELQIGLGLDLKGGMNVVL